MEKHFSKIIGMPVVGADYIRALCSVKDIIIDPENGKVIAFLVDSRRNLVVCPMDILSMKHGVWIKNEQDIINSDDVLRVGKVLKEYGSLIRKKVVTENGKVLGKVIDFSIDDKFLVLAKLYTSKSILGIIQYDGRVVPSKHIISIEKDQITVKNDSGEVLAAEKSKAVSEAA